MQTLKQSSTHFEFYYWNERDTNAITELVGITNRDLNKLSNNEASSQSQCLQKELSDRFLQSLMNSISQ